MLENKQFHVLLAQDDSGDATQDTFLELVDGILQLQFFAASASELFAEDDKKLQQHEPTFVTIMQELVNHDQVEVRQKVLLMLTERLEVMTASSKHLRQVINLCLITTQFDSQEALLAFHQQVGLTQSAIMCMDILARFVVAQLEKDLGLRIS